MSQLSNRLIERLPQAARTSLLSRCTPCLFVPLEVLADPGATTQHIYFPTQGFVALLAAADDCPGVEVGMVGNEGMLGAHVALNVMTQPLHALVQGEGSALRIGTRAFRGELARSSSLRAGINKYICVLMAQLATSSACVRFHQVAPRLARWLLMSQDRGGSDEFRVTQEFLAYVLGVRRVGITAAASEFQALGLIGYHRGAVRVLDRTGLEGAACGCYAANRKAYRDEFE